MARVVSGVIEHTLFLKVSFNREFTQPGSATRRATSSKKMILYFTYESRDKSSHFPLFLTVKTITKPNLGQGETFEIKIKRLAFVVHVLRTTQNLLSSCCFAKDGKEMYQEL